MGKTEKTKENKNEETTSLRGSLWYTKKDTEQESYLEKEGIEYKKCPYCGGDVYKTDDGEYVCRNCSAVIEGSQIDHGPDWRAFNSKEQQENSRVGSPIRPSRHENFTTKIDWRNKDAYGNTLSAKKRSQMYRLRKRQNRLHSTSSSEKNLQYALSEIDRMGSALGLPQEARERASTLYRRALKEDLIRGRSIEGVASACIHIASQMSGGIPRSLDEIDDVSRVDRNEIGRTKSYISNKLSLRIEPQDPTKYTARFCNKLGLSHRVEQKANEIIRECEDIMSGKSPTGFAAAAIYTAGLVCDTHRTQKEIADVAQVTEVTIRNRYKEQIEHLSTFDEENLDIPK